MEVVDPFNFITTECLIPAAQLQLLSTAPLYRQDDYSPADDYGLDDTWPVSSDEEAGDSVPLPVDNVDEITFCSVPSTPDNQDDVIPSHSDELEGNTTGRPNDVVSADSDELERESAKKRRFSDLNDVVCEHSDELGFCAEGDTNSKLNGVVSGNSDELERLCVEREECFVTPSPSKEPRFFDLNDVVCDSTEKLGFSIEGKESRFREGEGGISAAPSDLNDVVCGNSDELGLSIERKRAREESSVTPPPKAKRKLRFCDEVENTISVTNDVVCENTDGLGLRRCENDVVCESTDDLGLRFRDNGDKIAVGNTEEMVNDVVSEDLNELRVCSEERTAKEDSLTPVMENNKEVTNDVVSEDSIDLGFHAERNTTNEEFVSPTTTKELRFCDGDGADVENTKTVSDGVDSGQSVGLREKNMTKEESVRSSAKTAKELRSPELDRAEMEMESENTAVASGDTEEVTVDDEEVTKDDVILDNTEEIDTSVNDSGDGDTEEVAKDEELKDSACDRNSKAETCGNHVKCLMEVMKMLAERSEKGKDGEGGEVDFLETAKHRGYTFPKPRWMSSSS